MQGKVKFDCPQSKNTFKTYVYKFDKYSCLISFYICLFNKNKVGPNKLWMQKLLQIKHFKGNRGLKTSRLSAEKCYRKY